MPKVKVKLQVVCRTDASGLAPVMAALGAVRRLTLPAKTFYWLNKISQVLDREFADYEAARIQLVIRLGQPVGDGGYQVPPANKAEFEREMESLNREIELPIEEGVMLPLPESGVADDWFWLMAVMDVFQPPPA